MDLLAHKKYFFTALTALFCACGKEPSLDGHVLFSAGGINVEPPIVIKKDEAPKAFKLPVLQPGWNQIPLEGASTCARGGKYSFFVRPGKVNKVVIDFAGGGACWTASSCSYAGALFIDSIDDFLSSAEKYRTKGVYDVSREDNPFRDWYHVLLPYCTGDLHWGDSTATYAQEGASSSLTIQHRGAVNVSEALSWVFQQFEQPEKILVTGCSAGGYASIYWFPAIRDVYEQSSLYHLSDSAAGIITPFFFNEGFPRWNAIEHAPTWVEGLTDLSSTYASKSLPDLYESVAAYYPDVVFSQFNTVKDSTQSFFFTSMGGRSSSEWSAAMRRSQDRLVGSTPNYRAFQAPGSLHCILLSNQFYTLESEGVKYLDWLNSLLEDETPSSQMCGTCL